MVTVEVPASTTNLGPAFDALGMALQLHNRISLVAADEVRVEAEGDGSERLARDCTNLVYRAAARLYAAAGQPEPTLHVRVVNTVPIGRGLGSSATAIVGGLVAANRLLGDPLSPDAVLELAVEMEGHPDNVTPALYGGLIAATHTEEGTSYLRLPTPAGIRAVVAIPEMELATADARAVLPADVPRRDAVFNVGRVALLVAALLTNHPEQLRVAMQDRLHQPYRAKLLPGFNESLQAALDAGAYGACLSGAGSTLLALAGSGFDEIGTAMSGTLSEHGLAASYQVLDVDEQGARVVE